MLSRLTTNYRQKSHLAKSRAAIYNILGGFRMKSYGKKCLEVLLYTIKMCWGGVGFAQFDKEKEDCD